MATNKEIPATGSGEGQTPPPLAPPVDAITKMELFLEKKWRSVVAVLLVFISAVVVFFFLQYKKEDGITQSNQAYTSAVTPSDFEAVEKKFPGSAAAGSALFMIADRKIKSADFDGAEATLQKFIADYPDHPRHIDALFGLGGIKQKEEKYDEALENFQKVIDMGENSAKRPLAAIFMGETLVAKGELEKAKELYEAFGKNYPGTFVTKAEERLEAVKKRIAQAAAPKAPVEPEDPKPEPKVDPKPAVEATTPTPGAPNTPAAGGAEVPTPTPAVEGEGAAIAPSGDPVVEAVEKAVETVVPTAGEETAGE